jgi:hypothetical protein
MLNRLMFIYFIQKKGFLNGDTGYLETKLKQTQEDGKDRYYSHFLCPLFFEGFAKKENERSAATNAQLGKVPYLNGGLFLRHQIEESHGKNIRIPDAAFERIFAFFKQYRQWHLDDRPLCADNEINPNVLGYIFEKYINQKQMGAYYTKEDITGYIGQNTVIPFLFDAAQKKCKIAFEGEHAVWRLLQADPNRYIYPAVRKGVELPLPEEIAAGLNDVSKRTEWNKAAPEEYALPTEIWREVVARRKRYEEVKGKLIAGEIQSANDLITYNLDIRQFAQDVIENCEGPELLRAFYHAIEQVTVLDPACGSGAFLFAALNILEPLYEACLDRMESFLEDLERSGEKHRPEKFSDFRRILERVAQHPNRRYFILKSIILNNLYGVDIMEEATEICKLRLFLKLVGQIESVEKIEPLPDIDFNIRAGNTLVGYATYEDVRGAVSSRLDFAGTMQKIEEKAEDVERLFAMFRLQQTEKGGEVTAEDKAELRWRLKVLEDQLNEYLAGEYRVKVEDRSAYRKWMESHKPFHWFIEFHGIMGRNGFDAVIGNPPYVEYSKVKSEYSLLPKYSPFSTNLYCAFAARISDLKSASGFSSFIVPISLPSTDRMQALRQALNRSHAIYYVSFSTRPSKLFEGAEQRLTIFIQVPSRTPNLFSGGCLKWYGEERDCLFSTISYGETRSLETRKSLWPKTRGHPEMAIYKKLAGFPSLATTGMLGRGAKLYYKNTGLRYFNTVTLRPPRCWINGKATSSSRETLLDVSPKYRGAVHTFLLSSTFFMYYQFTSNCRDLNPSDINLAPIPDLTHELPFLQRLSEEIEEDYTRKGRIIKMNNKLTGLVEVESVTPANSKDLIDHVDRALAKEYGFTAEELDHIINYDIKYRMGREAAEEE